MQKTNCTCVNCQKVWKDNIATTSVASGSTPTIVFENAAQAMAGFAPSTDVNKAPSNMQTLHAELQARHEYVCKELHNAQRQISLKNEEIERLQEHVKQLDDEITDRAKCYNELFVKQSETDRACNDLIRQLQKRDEEIDHLTHKRIEDAARITNQYAEISQLHKEITQRDARMKRFEDRRAEDLDRIAHLEALPETRIEKSNYDSLLNSYEAANDTIKQIIQQKEYLEKELDITNEELRQREQQVDELRLIVKSLSRYII